ncbi:MAG TPA: hypothetical protein VK458_06695, partial [Myxococcaceae bacterium]|nr:hypothetical protein [Myxococcaceae bacterium]
MEDLHHRRERERGAGREPEQLDVARVVRHGPGGRVQLPGGHARGLQHPAQALLALSQPLGERLHALARQHLLGHLEAEDVDAHHVSGRVARRLVHDIEEGIHEGAITPAVEPHCQLAIKVGLAGAIDALERRHQALVHRLGHRLPRGPADQLAVHPDEPLVERVGELVDELGPAKRTDDGGSVLDERGQAHASHLHLAQQP